ncbi:MAG: hypothetical protein JWM10_3690 [Myxococcaceae bacterium]|nr:hypothetical protein [Myxococcaceae bacterium]
MVLPIPWLVVTADGAVLRSDTFLSPARPVWSLPCAFLVDCYGSGWLAVVDARERLSVMSGRGPLVPVPLDAPVLVAAVADDRFGAAVGRAERQWRPHPRVARQSLAHGLHRDEREGDGRDPAPVVVDAHESSTPCGRAIRGPRLAVVVALVAAGVLDLHPPNSPQAAHARGSDAGPGLEGREAYLGEVDALDGRTDAHRGREVQPRRDVATCAAHRGRRGPLPSPEVDVAPVDAAQRERSAVVARRHREPDAATSRAEARQPAPRRQRDHPPRPLDAVGAEEQGGREPATFVGAAAT